MAMPWRTTPTQTVMRIRGPGNESRGHYEEKKFEKPWSRQSVAPCLRKRRRPKEEDAMLNS